MTPIQPMIEHMSIGVSDYARALAFYDAALAPLGFVRVSSHEEPEGGIRLLGAGRRDAVARGHAGRRAVLDPAPG